MRNPTIHIRKSDLNKVFGSLAVETNIDLFIKECQPYQIRNRHSAVLNTKSKKKLDRATDATSNNVEVFNRALYAARTAAHHQFIKQILKSDKEFVTLSEVCKDAEEFIALFDLEKIEGMELAMKKYAEIGVHLMGKKYALNKFKYYKSQIFEIAEALILIGNDPVADKTSTFIKLFKTELHNHSPLAAELLDKLPIQKQVHFIYGRQEADDAKAKYANWIKAQFEELAWLNALPEPSQLHGINAVERYRKYMSNATNVASTKEDREEPNNYTDSQKAYFELLKSRKAQSNETKD